MTKPFTKLDARFNLFLTSSDGLTRMKYRLNPLLQVALYHMIWLSDATRLRLLQLGNRVLQRLVYRQAQGYIRVFHARHNGPQ